ncbi:MULTISPECIES: hypothetical protein [unclassified Streptomyces]|uniref:hypothetical protein n=1 Tax=unclassified Streptomyces TaxID=2593676 RepID=UPI0036FD9A3B
MGTEYVIGELLEEGLDDWVPVDRLIGLAQETVERSGRDFRDVARETLTQLLGRGLMEVGDLGESGFEAWTGTPDALVRRVVSTLEEFDWLPQGGACWLANTAYGDTRAPR